MGRRRPTTWGILKVIAVGSRGFTRESSENPHLGI